VSVPERDVVLVYLFCGEVAGRPEYERSRYARRSALRCRHMHMAQQYAERHDLARRLIEMVGILVFTGDMFPQADE